jgi:hypothetical protein
MALVHLEHTPWAQKEEEEVLLLLPCCHSRFEFFFSLCS